MQFLKQLLRSDRTVRSGSYSVRKSTNQYHPEVSELESRLTPALSIGSAGNFAVLGLSGTIMGNGSSATVNGSEGVSQGGFLISLPKATVSGGVVESAAGEVFNLSGKGVSPTVNPTLLNQADADAASASSQAKALAPTQSFGSITKATTVVGNGGLNVININGSISSSLTLSGGANDVFVVNVTGSMSLGRGAVLGLVGGVTANHVLYNFVGGGGSVVTSNGSVVNGTLLGTGYSFDLAGTLNGEVIGGGAVLVLESGWTVNQASFVMPAPAGPSSLSGFVRDIGKHTGLANVTVTLTGTDAHGNPVSLTTTTAADGSYSFTGLAAGNYTLTAFTFGGYVDNGDMAGTVNGQQDGTTTTPGSGVISNIVLGAAQDGVNYNFGFIFLQA
jgi:hypothetical protein